MPLPSSSIYLHMEKTIRLTKRGTLLGREWADKFTSI